MGRSRSEYCEKPCEYCHGCGHMCTRCDISISGCYCDEDYGLDTEEMTLCDECNGTGIKPPLERDNVPAEA